jgi:hypothetical protein
MVIQKGDAVKCIVQLKSWVMTLEAGYYGFKQGHLFMEPFHVEVV